MTEHYEPVRELAWLRRSSRDKGNTTSWTRGPTGYILTLGSAIIYSCTRARLVAIIIAVVAAAAGVASPNGEYAATGSEYGGTTEPEYGGKLVYVCDWPPPEGASWELAFRPCNLISGVLEKPGIVDWEQERDHDFFSAPFVSEDRLIGALVETWSWSDPVTLVLYVRPEVYWHDKPPLNGRRLAAFDIATHFTNLLLSDDEESHCRDERMCTMEIKQIEHTENPSVIFHFKEPPFYGLPAILDSYQSFIFPPELIEQEGDSVDWKKLVGTGPFMLTDYSQGTSITWARNPNYWAFDERYPDNRLPYVDELQALIIKDSETRSAVLRSGKIDYMGPAAGIAVPLDAAESLKRVNSELELWETWIRSDNAYAVNVNNAPFDDINVRTAMQLALDLEKINDDLFGGRANWKPHGLAGDALAGYFTPFEDWPEALKQDYMYDPAEAEKRLDEAGYPRGADGVRFRTTLSQPQDIDSTYADAAADYWHRVGVEVDIQPLDALHFNQMARESSLEGLSWTRAGVHDFDESLATRWQGGAPFNPSAVNDSKLNSMINELRSARESGEVAEYERKFREIDLYLIEQHLVIWGPEAPRVQLTQPWLKGFNGEFHLGSNNTNALFARLWIDADRKSEMAH